MKKPLPLCHQRESATAVLSAGGFDAGAHNREDRYGQAKGTERPRNAHRDGERHRGAGVGFEIARATDLVLKCEQAKLKALGKQDLCLDKNLANVLGGKPDKSATCVDKFQTAKAGTAARYVDNGDGTVSDLDTGLVWEKKDLTCPGAHCYSDTFTWSTGTPYNPNGTAFTIFLYGLNGPNSSDSPSSAGCFTGHCDWRLPTVEELAGIVDTTQGNCGGGSGPCIDPAFDTTQADFYWSATTDSSASSNDAWFVYFGGTTVAFEPKVDGHYVRAVRGGL